MCQMCSDGSRGVHGDLIGGLAVATLLTLVSSPLSGLFAGWREQNTNVAMTLSEMTERDLALALDERRLDAISSSLMPGRETSVGHF
jgi:hypothetical protein